MRLTLNGYVVHDDDRWLYEWFGYSAFSPAQIRDALASLPAGEELTLEINSPGGDVMAGNEIYSVLRKAAADGTRVVAEIQSMAASAASYFCLGCVEVLISPVAQMMIHLPSIYADGDYHGHEHTAGFLRGIGESILNAYELRSAGKSDRETLRQWMESETWMTAQEALEAGLVDGILYADGETPLQLPETMAKAIGGGIRAAAANGMLPDPGELRRKAAAAGVTAPGTKGVPDSGTNMAYDAGTPALKDDWRARGRLSLALRGLCQIGESTKSSF